MLAQLGLQAPLQGRFDHPGQQAVLPGQRGTSIDLSEDPTPTPPEAFNASATSRGRTARSSLTVILTVSSPSDSDHTPYTNQLTPPGHDPRRGSGLTGASCCGRVWCYRPQSCGGRGPGRGACQGFCDKWFGSQVGVDSFWVGQCQLLEGLFPVGGYRPFDEPARGSAFAGW